MKSLKTKEVNFKKSRKMENNIRIRLKEIEHFLLAFSLKLTRNEFDKNDLYQDTILRIIVNAEKFAPGTNFKAWASTIMRNIFINNYRKKKRQPTNFDFTVNDSYLNSGRNAIENNGETKMAYKELLQMVSRLPEVFKRPFWMLYQGYKYQEIAEEMNAPVGTIKSRIFFARKKLKEIYALETHLQEYT